MKTIKMICVFALAPIIAALFVGCQDQEQDQEQEKKAMVLESNGTWTNRSFYEKSGECLVQSESGNWVSCTYYTKDECKVQAEDGSWVPCSFYSYEKK